MKNWIKRKKDIIVVAVLWAVFIILILVYPNTILGVYSNEINQNILNFSGTLFGLLLTAYAILFGLIPALSKEALETKALSSVNFRFVAILFLSFFTTAIGFIVYFTDGLLQIVLIYLQMILLIGTLLMTPLLVLYLYYLFLISKSCKA